MEEENKKKRKNETHSVRERKQESKRKVDMPVCSQQQQSNHNMCMLKTPLKYPIALLKNIAPSTREKLNQVYQQAYTHTDTQTENKWRTKSIRMPKRTPK